MHRRGTAGACRAHLCRDTANGAAPKNRPGQSGSPTATPSQQSLLASTEISDGHFRGRKPPRLTSLESHMATRSGVKTWINHG